MYIGTGQIILDLSKIGCTVVLGNILASAHGGVGYLQPRGRVSSPFIHHLLRASSRFAIFKKHFKVVFCTSVIS